MDSPYTVAESNVPTQRHQSLSKTYPISFPDPSCLRTGGPSLPGPGSEGRGGRAVRRRPRVLPKGSGRRAREPRGAAALGAALRPRFARRRPRRRGLSARDRPRGLRRVEPVLRRSETGPRRSGPRRALAVGQFVGPRQTRPAPGIHRRTAPHFGAIPSTRSDCDAGGIHAPARVRENGIAAGALQVEREEQSADSGLAARLDRDAVDPAREKLRDFVEDEWITRL